MFAQFAVTKQAPSKGDHARDHLRHKARWILKLARSTWQHEDMPQRRQLTKNTTTITQKRSESFDNNGKPHGSSLKACCFQRFTRPCRRRQSSLCCCRRSTFRHGSPTLLPLRKTKEKVYLRSCFPFHVIKRLGSSLLVWLLFILGAFIFLVSSLQQPRSWWVTVPASVRFQNQHYSNSKGNVVHLLPSAPLADKSTKDYGGLRISFAPPCRHHSEGELDQEDNAQFLCPHIARAIQQDQVPLSRDYVDPPELPRMYLHREQLPKADTCQRPAWSEDIRPNCVSFHDVDIGRDYPKIMSGFSEDSFYIASGFYRDVWMISRGEQQQQQVLWKQSRWLSPAASTAALPSFRWLHGTQQEAVIMEHVSERPELMDLYGYCGTTVAIEPIPYEVEEYVIPGTGYRKDVVGSTDRVSANEYTVDEKWDMAIQMGESIAVLHNYKGGRIVHNDIQLRQWMRTKKGRLKLGDFNRAKIMEHQSTTTGTGTMYCKYSTGVAFGNVRISEMAEYHQLVLSSFSYVF